ncbi:MAG: ATP-grasp domain-containing protein [Nanoarchaeota archaeon]|nr:ATP-grasp domain-containing protein [Nanoarchaeota archaeon]
MDPVLEAKLDPHTLSDEPSYFFSFLGERFSTLTNIWRERLERRFKKKFEPIWVLQAKQDHSFNIENYVIVNGTLCETQGERYSNSLVCLRDYEDLNREFSESEYIGGLVRQLIEKQGTVFILGFTSSFLRDFGSRVKVLGPNPGLSHHFDNKIEQVRLFNKLDVPCVRASIHQSIDSVLTENNFPFFVSAAYATAGGESSYVYSRQDLLDFYFSLKTVNQSMPLVVSELIEEIGFCPNVNAIVTGENSTHIIYITDQILRGKIYLGNVYPSRADDHAVDTIKRTTTKIGNYLSTLGYKGLFGLDFIVDSNNNVYTIDLNPRRQGGYACNVMMSRGIDIVGLELELALNGQISDDFDYEDFQMGGAVAYTKVKPHAKNARIGKSRTTSHRSLIAIDWWYERINVLNHRIRLTYTVLLGLLQSHTFESVYNSQ